MAKKKVKRTVRKNDSIPFHKKRFGIGLVFILLILAAVFAGARTSFYGVAVGILIGFLVPILMRMIKES